MTTPEQLLADAAWRRRNSTYTLWALLIGFGFVSLLYTGAKAKKQRWIVWGAVYAALVIPAVAIAGSLAPDDPEAPTPAGANLATTVFMVVWVVSAIHVFRERKEWLRWKAGNVDQAPWYQAPSVVGADPPPPVGLGGIGLDDPTSDYLASTLPPPPPMDTTTRRLPAPPISQARPTARPLPPTPATPRLGSEAQPESTANPVDLNTATADELASLPGVGVATARRIVDERDRRGGFASVDEAAMAVKMQPHVRSRLQQLAVVSDTRQPDGAARQVESLTSDVVTVRVSRIEPVTRAEGPGTRWAIWTQGCSIGCPECCNPHTWDRAGGTAVDVRSLIGQMLETPVEGITLLGGEPFDQAEGLATIARAARAADLGVMTFTGYRYEVLARSTRTDWAALLNATDLLVDGPYLSRKRDTTRPWVGSSNQRFVHLTDRYRHIPSGSEPDRIEVRIRRDGAVAINGWPDDQLMSAIEDLLNEPL